MLVAEAVRSGAPLLEVFVAEGDSVGRDLADAAGVDRVDVAAHVLASIATTETPQSPIAIVETGHAAPPQDGSLLVAWGVADPGNVGSLIRTAGALDIGFVAGPDTADVWSPKVVRAGAGAHFRTVIARCATPGDLRSAGRLLVGTAPTGGVAPRASDETVAVLVGSESHGLPKDILDECDLTVSIPMSSASESLNAGVAGAIVAYAMTGHLR